MPDVMTRLDEVVDRVVETEVAHLPDAELGAQILGIDRALRRLEAARATRVREFELRDAGIADGAGSAVAWLRARTNTSKRNADAARALGRDCERLPVMAAALAAGEVCVAHVQVLAAATRRLDADRVSADEKALVDFARALDPRGFRVCVERWVALTFPDEHETDSEKQYDSRWLRLADTIDGMVAVTGMLDPDTARPIRHALHTLARRVGPTDDRTQAQRNADAIADLARTAANTDQLPAVGGSRPTVNIVVPSEGPGTYDDGTPLTNPALDRTLCDARLAAVIVDATGRMLDYGRTTRAISPALRKYLHLRDGGCRAPGCHAAAHTTDAHHIRWWRYGGRTDRDNLVLLCAFHHHLVHERAWTIQMDTDAVVTVTSPDGRSWTSQPRGPTYRA